MNPRKLAVSAAALLGSVGFALVAAAQPARPELPAAVQEWLEADQLQRWATMLEQGEKLFNEGSCARCHGEGGKGGPWAPDLTDEQWEQTDGSLEQIREVIFWGVRRRDFKDPSRRFEMNPSGGMNLEWDQMRALAAYVWSLENGTFLPQR